jgi:hypothetical protein
MKSFLGDPFKRDKAEGIVAAELRAAKEGSHFSSFS